MASVKHVWCSVNGDDTQLGHIVRSSYKNEAGEAKSDVYVDGGIHAMTYREPEDRDAGGAGSTYWNIVVSAEGSNQE